MLGKGFEIEKMQNSPERWKEIKARILEFNDFNLVIAGATALVGIIYFALRTFGYDLPLLF
ncbi:hypothetical protein C7U61_18590 [Rhizobium sp. JAB6]|nr:hypothetical protein C7U61_18590 [Rhizobium sp. JAB6]